MGPLIGLLAGVGIDQYNKLSNRQDRRMLGREYDEAMGGNPNLMSDPNAYAQALARAGLVTGADTLPVASNIFNQGAMMERQRHASGPSYMNANLAQEQWGVSPANPQSPTYQDPNAPYDPQADPLMQRWYLQQQYARDNALPIDQPGNFSEWLQLQQHNIAQNAGLRDTMNTFNETMRPLYSFDASVDEALRVLSDASDGPEFWSSQDSSDARRVVNDAVTQAMMSYWSQVLGRTDAPGESDMVKLDKLFPTMSERAGDNRESVKQVLEIARARNIAIMNFRQQQLMRTIGAAPPGGSGEPASGANDGLPPGFVGDD